MTNNFHKLTIAEIRKEIGGDATSVEFAIPPGLSGQFGWQAGQHLTLRFLLDGVEHRRSYTISNPPDAPLRITVKRVQKGLVSNHVADNLAVGQSVEVMPPFGSFKLVPDQLARRTHYFFAAGSGITPIYAMICDLLKKEPHSVTHLVFGNAKADQIIFREDLDTLASTYPDRLSLKHVLSAPAMWSWFTPWRSGRIDAETIQAAIRETPPVAQEVQYWVCGPGSMNADVKNALMSLDVPANRIHSESFGGDAPVSDGISGVASTMRVTLDGVRKDVPIATDQSLLDALRAADMPPPFSCQSGVCGACRAHLTQGKVHMRRYMALEDHEIAKGEILTCQSIAQTETLEVKFEA
jgi:ring-1,2-phenylacetyl-CoA epoxidase subunit PaaE